MVTFHPKLVQMILLLLMKDSGLEFQSKGLQEQPHKGVQNVESKMLLIWFSVCFRSQSPKNVEKIARLPGGDKRVKSCHASGCECLIPVPNVRVFKLSFASPFPAVSLHVAPCAERPHEPFLRLHPFGLQPGGPERAPFNKLMRSSVGCQAKMVYRPHQNLVS